MRRRQKFYAFFSLLGSAVLLIALPALLFTCREAPHPLLVDKLDRLKRENDKLHEDIRILALELRNLERDTKKVKHIASRGATIAKYHGRERGEENVIPVRHDHSPESSESESENECEVVHISMVAAGYNTARTVITLIKSILFYRLSPLHFHFVTDSAARHILSTVFKTWQLPSVNVSFYAIETAADIVSWIPNSHYSGIYGLMKLTLVRLLPEDLDHVIVLDTDLMLTDNIASLWDFFKEIRRQGKLLGVVENQSNWYLGKLWEKQRPWPALGRGFNTGVMLLHLNLMRAKDWVAIWTAVAKATLEHLHSRTSLADQDIVNAVIKKHPDIHFILPCSWNAQMSEHSLNGYCFSRTGNFKIIHWNSPLKLMVKNNHGAFFRSRYMAFENYNGYLFRHDLSDCNHLTSVAAAAMLTSHSSSPATDPCWNITREKDRVRITHPYIVDYKYSSDDEFDVTLVAQLSTDRLMMLEQLCQHWDGPMSISFYGSDSDVQDLLKFHSSSSILQDCKARLGLHVVYKSGQFYPINYLRNIALDNVQTPYSFLSDIDFLPMNGLYLYLKEAIRVLGVDKRTFIVPAFETLLYRFKFPASKSELLRMLEAHSIFTFRYHVWKAGHSATNYDHWKNATVPYRVSWSQDYEPYIVVRSNALRYDERFVGFGWNKVSYVMELDARGYEFVVLPNPFIIHLPHSPSRDISSHRQSKQYRDCLRVLKRQFQQELVAKYGEKALKYQS